MGIFRAETFTAAKRVLGGMAGINGMVLPSQILNLAPFLKHFVSGQGTVPLLADGTATGFTGARRGLLRDRPGLVHAVFFP